ncbi:putative ribonuclease H-like domain-containing protein [Tanacetum coccineum]
MDVKSAFLYGTIEEEVYVTQSPGFKDPDHPDKVYKVVKALYGLHQAPRAWYETLANYLLGNGFKRGKIDQTLITEILKKFNYTNVKSASTLVDLEKPLVKDRDADDVDVHLYRSIIGSLMYLTTSRPNIMFADSLFELVAYTDSDYAGATQDRKSTTGGCQFLGNRLISWQCKKETMVATSTIEAEYVAAASCCGQVLWIRDLLTKGFDADRHVKRGRDTKIPQSSGPPVKVGDEAVHKELGDRMERAATTASSLEAEQDSATARTTNDGEVEITASIDGQAKTITEASLRRHLKLEDSDVVDETVFTSVDVDVGGAATTNIGLEAVQGSGTIHKTPSRPHDLPLPKVHTLGSDEGSLQQNELMDLVTKLTDRVKVLENDMQQTKKVYSSALTKLILRVKTLEKKVKTNKARRRARIVISEDEDAKEDSSK